MTLETLLAELLREPLEVAEARAATAFDRIAAPFENQVVVFGAGHLGRLAVSGLRAAGIEPLAFCDNKPKLWDTRVDHTPVLSPPVLAGCIRIRPHLSRRSTILPQSVINCGNSAAPGSTPTRRCSGNTGGPCRARTGWNSRTGYWPGLAKWPPASRSGSAIARQVLRRIRGAVSSNTIPCPRTTNRGPHTSLRTSSVSNPARPLLIAELSMATRSAPSLRLTEGRFRRIFAVELPIRPIFRRSNVTALGSRPKPRAVLQFCRTPSDQRTALSGSPPMDSLVRELRKPEPAVRWNAGSSTLPSRKASDLH